MWRHTFAKRGQLRAVDQTQLHFKTFFGNAIFNLQVGFFHSSGLSVGDVHLFSETPR